MKRTALLTGARSFDGCVQGQHQSKLEHDARQEEILNELDGLAFVPVGEIHDREKERAQ